MQKFAKILISIGLLSVCFSVAAPIVYAQGVFDVPEGLCGSLCPTEGDAVSGAKSLVEKLGGRVKVVIGAVAILIIVIAGVKLVVSNGNEEEFTKQSTTLIWGIIGLFVIGLAGEISTIFSVSAGSDLLSDPSEAIHKSRLFNNTVQIVMTFMKYIIGSLSVIFIIRSALRLITVGGNDDEVQKDKKSIGYGVLGLVVILMADPIINKVFFKVDTDAFPGLKAVRPGIDSKRLVEEIAGVVNVVAAITGPIALLALVGAGLMYTLAAGDEERSGKAKKIIQWAIIGIVIIYGSFGIVSTFIARQFVS